MPSEIIQSFRERYEPCFLCNQQLQYDAYHPGGGIGLPSLGIVMERKEIYMANNMECEVSYSYSRGRMNNQPAAYLFMQYIR